MCCTGSGDRTLEELGLRSNVIVIRFRSIVSRPPIIDRTQSYTFDRYFELTADPEEIFAELDCRLVSQPLQIPSLPQDAAAIAGLLYRIEQSLELVDLSSEIARRETLISPILLEVCSRSHQKMKIEYAVNVSNLLKGSVRTGTA